MVQTSLYENESLEWQEKSRFEKSSPMISSMCCIFPPLNITKPSKNIHP